jgi:hypothetical protein
MFYYHFSDEHSATCTRRDIFTNTWVPGQMAAIDSFDGAAHADCILRQGGVTRYNCGETAKHDTCKRRHRYFVVGFHNFLQSIGGTVAHQEQAVRNDPR